MSENPRQTGPSGDSNPGGGASRWLIWIVIGLVAALAVLAANALAGENAHRLIYLGLLLVFVGVSVWWAFIRGNVSRSLRHGAIWVVIGAVLIAGYSLRDQVSYVADRIKADHVPGFGFDADDNAVSFRAGPDGHFHVTAEVDGVEILFLVDTGATDVVLTPADAQRLGFDPARLNYSQVYYTANGIGRGAPVRLDRVTIGPVDVASVRASVNETPMSRSLLGMSFLNRIGGYQVRGDVLTLLAR